MVIEESQSINAFSANTHITNNSTLTITSSDPGNWSVLIDKGSILAYTGTDAFKWGSGTNSHRNALLDNYGTIDMQSNKAFRFGDAPDGYSTTVNLYDGSLMTSTTGTFSIENYRGTNSILNVFEGASITNLYSIKTFDRNNESSATPLFELNVAGGSVTMSNNVDFGQYANANTETVQTSKINVTNGGTFTSTGTVNLGNAARNDAQINVSGEGSTFSSGWINISRNADATASVTVSDKGKIITSADTWVAGANNSTGTLNANSDGILSITNGTIYVGYGAGSTGIMNVNGGIVSQDSTSAKNIVFGQGTGSNAQLNITNGGQIIENSSVYNMFLGHVQDSVFTGDISGSKVVGEGESAQTVYSALNVSGILNLGDGAASNSTLNISNGGILNMVGASQNGSLYIGAGQGAIANLNVKSGGTFNVGGGLQLGNGVDSVVNMTVEKGGIFNVNVGSTMRLGVAAGSNATFKVDGGKFNMTAPSDLNVDMGYNNDSTSTFILTNSALLKQTGKNIQFNMWGGNNTLEVSKGAVWAANTNFYVGRNAGSVSTLNVNGGVITGSDESLTGFSSTLNTAAGASTTAYVNVTNGGIANFRDLNASQGGANSVSLVTVSGNGSSLSVRLANNTNYHNRWGFNKYEADGVTLNTKYVGNSAKLNIYTGAQFLNTQNAVQLFDSAQVRFVLDSKGITYAQDNSISMLKTAKLDIYKTDATVSSPFVIDGSALGELKDANEGDIYEIALFTVTGTTTLNGVAQDFSIMDEADLLNYLSITVSLENNKNLYSWEDFDLTDIVYNGDTFYLTLTYVPEPSTYAAIFGALALAFVAYRRKNK